MWKKTITFIIGILFPKKCPFCEELMDITQEQTICDNCRAEISWINEKMGICSKCSKPLVDKSKSYCYDCEKTKHHYYKGRALWLYAGRVQDSIIRYKFNGKRGYYRSYVTELVKCFDKQKDWNIDIITSVPMHKYRLRDRGYNQSALLAEGFAVETGIKLDNKLLIRVKNTARQKDLSDLERILNMKNAFLINNFELEGKNILVIDDIYTTGSTLDGCAAELIKYGAAKVYFMTLAIGKGL